PVAGLHRSHLAADLDRFAGPLHAEDRARASDGAVFVSGKYAKVGPVERDRAHAHDDPLLAGGRTGELGEGKSLVVADGGFHRGGRHGSELARVVKRLWNRSGKR